MVADALIHNRDFRPFPGRKQNDSYLQNGVPAAETRPSVLVTRGRYASLWALPD